MFKHAMLLKLSKTCHAILAISAARLRSFLEALVGADDLAGSPSEPVLVCVLTCVQHVHVDVPHVMHVSLEHRADISMDLVGVAAYLCANGLWTDKLFLVSVGFDQFVFSLILQSQGN